MKAWRLALMLLRRPFIKVVVAHAGMGDQEIKGVVKDEFNNPPLLLIITE